MGRFLHRLFYVFLLPASLYAQSESYRFRHLSPSDGLSQSSVISIHQDRLGQMWFGTRDGLNKYDGHTFTVYRNDPDDSLSLSNNDILSLEEDQAGNIWVGTYNGLNRYNPRNDTFQRFLHANSPDSLSNNTIWCISETDHGELWIGTSEGLSVYDKSTGRFTTALHDEHDATSLPSSHVRSILQTRNGTIWIGTSKGICQLTQRTGNERSFCTYHPPDSLPAPYVQDIIEDRQDSTLWIATRERGLLRFNPNVVSFAYAGEGSSGYRNSDVRALSQDNDGTLWAGTYEGIIILPRDGPVQKIFSHPSVSTSLTKNSIKAVYTDRKGSVWIGTYHGGVNSWDRSNDNFYYLDENVLHYDVVSAIAANEDNLFFATEGQGITQVNTKTGESTSISTENHRELSGDHLKSLLLTGDEKLWIGTFKDGVNLYDTHTQQFVNHSVGDSLKAFLRGTGIYSMKEGRQNDIWFGTFGKGLIRYDRLSQACELFKTGSETATSLSGNQVRSLLVDREENVWVGTQSGLNLIAFRAGAYRKNEVKHFFFDPESGSGDAILTVFEDARGRIWVGTKAKGLFSYNGVGFDPVEITIPNVVVTAVHAILADDRQNLWLSTNRGIVKYNTISHTSTLYDQQDGLATHEFGDNTALKVGGTRFYFGGSSGVTSFDPENIVVNPYAPPVILTNFNVKNESIRPGSDEGVLDEAIAYTRSLTLAHDEANFSIAYAMPNFINSASNTYRYRLVGLADQWNTTSATEATYIIQNPGTYTFEVMGANNDGVWSKEVTSLEITVKPAPWRSGWAFMFYTLVIGTALFFLIRFIRYHAILKLALKLEHLAIERNQELHQEKLAFFTNVAHDFRTPLTLILGPLQQVLADYKGSNKVYKKLLVVESSANHLLKLINRLMDFRKLENDHTGLQAAEGNIVKFTREIYLSFAEFAKDGGYTYLFDSPEEEILAYYDRDKLERVFYNLISNAFRHTPTGGKITFSVQPEGTAVVLTVEDSGSGIAEENLPKVFDRFFKSTDHSASSPDYYQGTGVGLSIAKNIVALHQGSINVRNGDITGAVFTVTLPLGREHLTDEEILKDFKVSDDISQYETQLQPAELTTDDPVPDLMVNENNPTILLAEDNEALRHFIKTLLRKQYNVLEAENGEAAMRKALKYVPDLIISDIMMPEMVGTELCARIKENLRTSHIPVILLTSRTSLIYKVEGLESGADDYVNKPFNIREFELRVKNLLDATQRIKKKFSREDNRSPSEITVSSLDEKLLKKALEIVEENIANENFDITFFSAELGVSRTMLFTKVKAWTNFTPNEFIHHLRMKRAAQLLEREDLTVAEVSYLVGFRNPKYFSKCFQKKFSHTPSEYADKFSED